MSALPGALREDITADIDGQPSRLAVWRHPARATIAQRPPRPASAAAHPTSVDDLPLALLVHGFRGDHHGMDRIAAATHCTELLVPDLPGFGASPPLSSPHTLHTYTDAIGAVLGTISPERPVLLVGHSFGSIIAAHLAAADAAQASPRIGGLLLLNPIASPALEGPQRLLTRLTQLYYWAGSSLPERPALQLLSNPAIVRAMSIVMATTKDRGLRRYIHDQHARHFSSFTGRESLRQAFEVSIQHTVSEVAPLLTLPTTVLAGSADDIAPLSAQRRLVESLPEAELRVVDGVGHLVHYETPDPVGAAIDELALRLAAGAAR